MTQTRGLNGISGYRGLRPPIRCLSDFRVRVGVAANAVPPPFEIVTERARANDPRAGILPDVEHPPSREATARQADH